MKDNRLIYSGLISYIAALCLLAVAVVACDNTDAELEEIFRNATPEEIAKVMEDFNCVIDDAGVFCEPR